MRAFSFLDLPAPVLFAVNMADQDDFEIDPAIAEAMGFSGFGTQPGGKKRKFDGGDAFVDPTIKKQTEAPNSADLAGSARGANNTPLGQKSAPSGAENAVSTSEAHAIQGAVGGDASGRPDLQTLRHGIKNDRGDMAYFLPSFIEDPWKGLEPK
ncbi:hypothetical protein D0864_07715 [Hortaea werneckii]|uniref:Uncharacterized protein n=1 Tax=Hortaea werneckii TaxID=91943 RepID=A0A3M7F5K5_HORWE|nr:hypothetical protein D0864_07715 [Hortaea werneckii]